MGDYSNYIDWLFSYGGYDPADYANFDDFWRDVMKNHPPVNSDGWDVSSFKDLEAEAELTFGQAQKDLPTFIEEAKQRQYAKSRTEIESRLLKKRYGQVSQARRAHLREIEIARQTEDFKLSKPARNELKSTIALRAHELQDRYGYTRSDAWTRAWKELG